MFLWFQIMFLGLSPYVEIYDDISQDIAAVLEYKALYLLPTLVINLGLTVESIFLCDIHATVMDLQNDSQKLSGQRQHLLVLSYGWVFIPRRRHQMVTFSALLALCAGNSPVNSPHKGQWRGALMFSVMCAWIKGRVNNREAGDLRRHCAHYDVMVMHFHTVKSQKKWMCNRNKNRGVYWRKINCLTHPLSQYWSFTVVNNILMVHSRDCLG